MVINVRIKATVHRNDNIATLTGVYHFIWVKDISIL